MLEVCCDGVSCRLFPCPLNGRALVWYHNIPPNSIHNWKGFKNIYVEKFVDDKTLAMLLKELGNIKIEQKEEVKDFNFRFNRILNKFPANTKPHDSITINYYTSALPKSITQIVKLTMKETLAENYEEAIAVEKDLRAIEVIFDDEPSKDSKDMGKKSQATSIKAKEK